MDPQLQAVLTDRVSVWRPVVEFAPGMAPMTAAYEWVCDDLACAVQPNVGRTVAGLTGPVSAAEAVVYLGSGVVRTGDRLARPQASAELASAASAGDGSVAITAGWTVTGELWAAIGAEADGELCAIAGATEGGLVLASGLRREHEAGAPVVLVELLEVHGAADEAGRGHHTRAIATVVGG